MTAPQKDVLVIVGSASDEKYAEGCVKTLAELQIPYFATVASAHRTPERLAQVLSEHRSSAKVIIALAGHAAHLAGVIASQVSVPVIAVPLPTSELQGLDSLLAMVQMPGGIPVATMSIGGAGAKNAACFAAQVLALQNPGVKERWEKYRSAMAAKVQSSSRDFESQWNR